MKIVLNLFERSSVTAAGYSPQQKMKTAQLREQLAKVRVVLSRFTAKIKKLKHQWETIRKRRKQNDDPKLRHAETAVEKEMAAIRASTEPMRNKRTKLLKELKSIRVSAGFRGSLRKRPRKVNTKTKARLKRFKLS